MMLKFCISMNHDELLTKFQQNFKSTLVYFLKKLTLESVFN